MLHYPEAVEFVKNNPNLTTKQLHIQITKKFNIKISRSLVQQWRCKYILGYKKKKAEHPSWWARKVGDEFLHGKYIWIRTKDGAKPKQQFIYEQYNNPVKKDEVVIFLDNDHTNFNIDNLYCLKRQYLCIINKLIGKNVITKELKLLAINTAMLKLAASDKEIKLKGLTNPNKVYRLTDLGRTIISLHRQGKTNQEITKQLNVDPTHVTQTIRKYKLGYYNRFYKDVDNINCLV